LLPLINSGGVDLLDNDRLKTQLLGLERRTSRAGRDSIDHSPGGHDDIANAVAGAIVNVPTTDRTARGPISHEGIGKYNPLSGTFGAQR
jgi:hypothetical protein